jgi:hypothetical protein
MHPLSWDWNLIMAWTTAIFVPVAMSLVFFNLYLGLRKPYRG